MEPRTTVKEKAKRANAEKKNVEKKLTAEDIAENIRQGLAEVKLIQEGKMKGTTLKDLLNEL